MQGFVRNREGRAASPVQKGPQNANTSRRQLVASSARIGVPPTHLSSQHTLQPSQPAGRQQSLHGRMSPPPKPSSQHIKQEDRGHTGSQKRDPYGTDAESLDTTIHSHGEVLVEDSQLYKRGIPFAQHSDGRKNYSGSEPEDGEESEEDIQEEGDMFNRAVQLGELQREIFHGNLADESQMFGADDSYPTTTSGRLEDDEAAEDPPSDLVDEENISQAQTQDQERKHTSPHFFQHGQSIAQGQRNPSTNPKTIYQKGQALRQANRPNPNLTLRQTIPPADISRPQSEPTHKKNVRYQPNPFYQTGHPTPQSVHDYPSDQSRYARNKSVVSTITGAHIHHVPASDFASEEDEKIPFEDYEVSELYKISYDELKSQPLDFDPRAPPSVIPHDMIQNPLPERLEFVQHHLAAQDQRKFFDLLPIKEWEEAGDWFAEQFGDVVKKMTDARRKKRKLAMEFEHEIERRHEIVAKRQRMVEKAMRKMRASGQGLLPKTPKRST